MRLGFACKYMHSDQTLKPKILKEHEQPLNCRATTVRWLNEHKSEAEERLWDLMQHNIASVHELVKYVATLPDELKMVRISSPVLPVATEASWKYFWSKPDVIDYCEKHFAPIGEFARANDVRLSMHPGQFTVLASDNPDIVDRSIEEFEYHVNMARWMGYGRKFQDFKINVHISGRQGPEGIIKAIPRLSPEARNLLTIENDEMGWGLESSLELEKHCALVLDIHHHWVRTGEYIQANDDRVKRIVDSWRGQRPTMHYSYSRDEWLSPAYPDGNMHENIHDMQTLLDKGCKKQKLRAHSELLPNRAVNEWALTFLPQLDIQVEAKMKNLAAEQLHNQAEELGLV